MSSRPLATSLAALALVAAAGCGGDDDDSGALSKAEYQKQGNALCREAISKTKEVDPPRSPDEIADYVDRLFDVAYGYLDEFEALEPPKELREAHDGSVQFSKDSRETIDELVERVREAENPQVAAQTELRKLAQSPDFERDRELTRALGLDDCLDVGAPGAEPEAS